MNELETKLKKEVCEELGLNSRTADVIIGYMVNHKYKKPYVRDESLRLSVSAEYLFLLRENMIQTIRDIKERTKRIVSCRMAILDILNNIPIPVKSIEATVLLFITAMKDDGYNTTTDFETPNAATLEVRKSFKSLMEEKLITISMRNSVNCLELTDEGERYIEKCLNSLIARQACFLDSIKSACWLCKWYLMTSGSEMVELSSMLGVDVSHWKDIVGALKDPQSVAYRRLREMVRQALTNPAVQEFTEEEIRHAKLLWGMEN